jgi:hypothetical protein
MPHSMSQPGSVLDLLASPAAGPWVAPSHPELGTAQIVLALRFSPFAVRPDVATASGPHPDAPGHHHALTLLG